MYNLMLDLETLGNKNNAAIVSIGAVFFDITTGQLGSEYYVAIDPKSALWYGDVDGSTIQWWMKQSEKAREVFNDPKAKTLKSALENFIKFVEKYKTAPVKVWGNGATFDNIILSNAFDRLRLKKPWAYNGDHDVRTMVWLGKEIKGIDPKKDVPLEGTAHNALDDAKHQAKYVSEIYKSLKGE